MTKTSDVIDEILDRHSVVLGRHYYKILDRNIRRMRKKERTSSEFRRAVKNMLQETELAHLDKDVVRDILALHGIADLR